MSNVYFLASVIRNNAIKFDTIGSSKKKLCTRLRFGCRWTTKKRQILFSWSWFAESVHLVFNHLTVLFEPKCLLFLFWLCVLVYFYCRIRYSCHELHDFLLHMDWWLTLCLSHIDAQRIAHLNGNTLVSTFRMIEAIEICKCMAFDLISLYEIELHLFISMDFHLFCSIILVFWFQSTVRV